MKNHTKYQVIAVQNTAVMLQSWRRSSYRFAWPFAPLLCPLSVFSLSSLSLSLK